MLVKALLLSFVLLAVAAAGARAENPIVVIETSKGTIKAELFESKAPITVKNFLSYVDDKFYDGTIFHRVIPGFMIQGGGFTEDFRKATTPDEAQKAQKKTKDPIASEAANGLANLRGTLAMARTNNPNSATAQFFINTVDNTRNLGPGGVDPTGYAVFGQVIEGMDVVDKIKGVKTLARHAGAFGDVPEENVVIKSIRRDKVK